MTEPEVEISETDETYCYVHKKTPTKLSCSRCGNPICGRCAIPATVGQHCPDCVAEARRGAPKVRSQLAAKAPVIMALLIINALVFGAQTFIGDEFTSRFLQVPPFIADGEYYRLFTAMFLHDPDNPLHLLFNMYILFSYGPFIEQWLGKARFIALYLLSGLAGSAASYTFSNAFGGSLGASGAIFGVVGSLLVLAYYMRGSAQGRSLMQGVLIFVGFNLIIGFSVGGIDNNAHLGGLVGGALITLGLAQNAHRFRAPNLQIATFVAAAVIIAAMVVRRTDQLKVLFPGL